MKKSSKSKGAWQGVQFKVDVGGKSPPVKVVDAPLPFTDEEISEFAYWKYLWSCLEWLWKEPKSREEKRLRWRFMAYFSKVKAAYGMVEEGRREVKIGKSPNGGVIKLTENPMEGEPNDGSELAFAIPFFLVWLSVEMSLKSTKDMLGAVKEKVDMLSRRNVAVEFHNKVLQTRIDELETTNRAMASSKFANKGGKGKSKGRGKRS